MPLHLLTEQLLDPHQVSGGPQLLRLSCFLVCPLLGSPFPWWVSFLESLLPSLPLFLLLMPPCLPILDSPGTLFSLFAEVMFSMGGVDDCRCSSGIEELGIYYSPCSLGLFVLVLLGKAFQVFKMTWML